MQPSQADAIIAKVGHLISPSHKRWYYAQLFALGERTFLLCADIASNGNNPAKCFSYWLKHPENASKWIQYKH